MNKKIFFTLFAFSSIQLCAQKNDPVSGGAAAQALDPYEIYAYRFADDILDVPVSGLSIDAAQVEDSNTQSMPDILRKEANIYFRSANGSSSSGQVSMRGYGENSQSRVLVLVDGQRLNPFDMGAFNWLQIAPFQVENIEVLRGAQSAVYGNNAVAGVIKIKTKSARDMADGVRGQAGGSYGAYGEESVWGRSDFKVGNVYASANARYYREDGYRANSVSWAKGAGASVGYIFDDYNDLVVRADYSREYLQMPGSLTYDQFKQNPRSSFNPSGDTESDYGLYSVEWSNATEFGEGGIRTGVNTRDMDWKLWGRATDNWQWSYSFSPQYRIYLGSEDKSLVEGGIDFTYDSMDSKVYTDLNRSILNVDTNMTRATVGPWVNGRLALNDTFTLSASARVEASVNSGDSTDFLNSGNSFSGSKTQVGPAAQFSINAKIDKRLSAYFRFDQIYRYPSFDEVGSYSGYGGSLIPYNNELDPEHGQNYEIGLNYKDEYGFRGGLALYYSMMKDEITWWTDPATYMGYNKNMDNVRRYGIDVSLSYEHKYFGASTAWSFVNAEFDNGDYSGKDVPLVPSIMGVNQIWLTPCDRVKITFAYTWTSSQRIGGDYANSSTRLDDYGVFDIRLNVKFCDYASFFAAFENLTDERYATYAYSGGGWGPDSYYPAVGRTFRVGLRLSW